MLEFIGAVAVIGYLGLWPVVIVIGGLGLLMLAVEG
jgi:hypothetical protein